MKPHLLCQQPGAYCERRWVRTVDGVRVCLWHPHEEPPSRHEQDKPSKPKSRPAPAPLPLAPLPHVDEAAAPPPPVVPLRPAAAAPPSRVVFLEQADHTVPPHPAWCGQPVNNGRPPRGVVATIDEPCDGRRRYCSWGCVRALADHQLRLDARVADLRATAG